MLKIDYYLVETEVGWKNYMVPLNPNMIGRYGIQSLIIEALMNNNTCYIKSSTFWHDGTPELFLNYLNIFNDSLVEACNRKLYMNENFGIYPGKVKIIEKHSFTFKKWSRNMFSIVIEKLSKLNDGLK
jgi:hypothetical protein